MSSDFHKKSYELHSGHYEEHGCGREKASHAGKWLLEDTVDAWRHRRMHELVKPLLDVWNENSWITVGDGRYGLEAAFIEANGGKAVATDISDTLLEESAARGFISAYSRQNAESLDYPDSSFDLALCKETYHHFPRPPVALYEMIRVTRKAVVLIEPTDLKIGATLRWKFFRWTIDTARKISGRKGGHQIFEETGNYVFGLSILEMEKAALAMNLPMLAVKGINDYYMPGLGDEKADRSSRLFRKVRRRIAVNDFLCRVGLKPHSNICIILFHQDPGTALAAHLVKEGFEIVKLPENPFV